MSPHAVSGLQKCSEICVNTVGAYSISPDLVAGRKGGLILRGLVGRKNRHSSKQKNYTTTPLVQRLWTVVSIQYVSFFSGILRLFISNSTIPIVIAFFPKNVFKARNVKGAPFCGESLWCNDFIGDVLFEFLFLLLGLKPSRFLCVIT